MPGTSSVIGNWLALSSRPEENSSVWLMLLNLWPLSEMYQMGGLAELSVAALLGSGVVSSSSEMSANELILFVGKNLFNRDLTASTRPKQGEKKF